MKNALVFERFVNGWSTGGLKEGVKDSFSYSRHMDFRKDPRLLTILPSTVKETGMIVTDLVTNMIQLPSGKYVAIDASGGIYTRTAGGTWSKFGSSLPSTTFGMVYNNQHDTVYVAGNTTFHAITNADGRFGGTMGVMADVFGSQIDQSATGSPNTYTTQSSIDEYMTNKLNITPTIEPLVSISIWVTTKGTGDLTVTMHDAANNILGTSTLPNASISSGSLNQFTFSPVRMLVKPNAGTYHFHITHSNGTASTIGTANPNDLSGARFEEYVNRLILPTNGFHPIIEFLQYYLIGNERYVTAWEPISQSSPSNVEWVRHRLTFPPGYSVTSFARWDEYVVIACEKRSTSATNEYQEGKLFIWDGTSVSYNRIIDVPEGSPYGAFSQGNIVYYFANGKWWAWSGGNPVPIFQMPNTDFEFTNSNTYMVNYPYSIAVRNSVLLGAFPSETNSTNIEHGVYSYGKRNKNYEPSFGFSYSMSTGSRLNTGSNNLRIGMIKSFGDKLFISWRDDSQIVGQRYGVDKVDPNSPPFSNATWESLLIDNGRPDKTKMAVSLRIDFKTLPTGATVTPKYKIDRGSYVSGTTAVAGSTFALLPINKRYKELQIAIDVVATTTTPEIIGATVIWESLKSEAD